MSSKLEVSTRKESIGLISRRQFYSLHRRCPDCSGKVDKSKIYLFEQLDLDFYDSINTAKCKCGWKGFIHELLPLIE